MVYITENCKETKHLGKVISNIIKKDIDLHSQIILLTGDLGAGKTILVKGIAEGLDISFNITSPTFNLINEYDGNPGLIHMDFYRIDNKDELINLGVEEYLDKNCVKAIEWPQLVFDYLEDDFIFIYIKRISENKRKIEVKAEGTKSKILLKRMKKHVNIRN